MRVSQKTMAVQIALLFCAVCGSTVFAADNVVIGQDGTVTPASYSDTPYTAVSATENSKNLGSSVNSISSDGNISCTGDIFGIHSGNAFSVTAESLRGGVALSTNVSTDKVSNLCAVQCDGLSANSIKNLGNVTTTTVITDENIADPVCSRAVLSSGTAQSFSMEVDFADNSYISSEICGHGEDLLAIGLSVEGAGKTLISNLSGINTSVSELNESVISNPLAPTATAYGMSFYGGADSSATVGFADGGSINSTVAAYNPVSGAYGIVVGGAGTTVVNNLKSIDVASMMGQSTGIHISSASDPATAKTEINFAQSGGSIFSTGFESAFGIHLDNATAPCDITVSNVQSITATKGSADTYGIKATSETAGTKFTVNFLDGGTVTSSESGKAGVFFQGQGSFTINNLSSISVSNTDLDVTALCTKGESDDFSATVNFAGDGGNIFDCYAPNGNAYSIIAAGSGTTTVNTKNAVLNGSILNSGDGVLALNFSDGGVWAPEDGDVTGNIDVNVGNGGRVDFKQAFTLSNTTKLTLNQGSTLAFYLDNFKAGDTIVDATANPLDITNAGVKLYQNSEKKLYSIGESVTLVDGATGTYSGEELNAYTEGEVTTRFKYKTALSSDNTLTATYLGKEAAPEAKSFSEGRLAGAAALTTASDLLAGEGIATAVAAAKASANGTAPFVQIAGSHGKFNTGSHVDLNSLNVVAGIAQKVKDNLTLGGYIEGGNSRYASYNQFDTGEIRADGDINYFGAGVFGKLDFNKTERGNAYIDAAIGAGYTTQDYATESEQLEAARYDASSKYIKAHATVGYQWNLAKGSVDGYAKYLWTRQSGDSPTLSTGEVVNFDAINSRRLRLGARYTQAIKKNFAWYGGLAYEYEFSMNAGANSQGYAIAEPDLKGGSGMAELGLKYAPLTTKGWLFDLGVQGFTGKRDSLGLRLGAWYEF